MAFILLLLVALATLVSVDIHTAGINHMKQEARENARFGMLVALGKLQTLAGPDQRVTGTADILNATADSHDVIAAEKSHWTGIWEVNYDEKTGTYSEALLNFLISGLDDDPTDPLAEAQDYALPTPGQDHDDFVELLGSSNVDTNQPGEGIVARKVDIGNGGRYAYWVGDEGVKARINLAAVSPAVSPSLPKDRLKLGAPSTSPGNVMVGLEDFPVGHAALERLHAPEEITVAEPSIGHEQLAPRFHDYTFTSVGIPTNTAQGGLKKDLSLAFEMEDDTFNQDSFFAGVLDNGFPDDEYPYVNHKFRYVYNVPMDYNDPGSRTIRGPTWHVLRNYYRQYREVNDVTQSPGIQAQVDQPLPHNPATGAFSSSWSAPGAYSLYWRNYADPLTTDTPIIPPVSWQGGWEPPIVRPIEGAIAPLLTRIQNVFSLRKVALSDEEIANLTPGGANSGYTDQVQIVWDPVVTLWNPYNVAITFKGLIIDTGTVPFRLNIRTSQPSYLFYGNGNRNDSVIVPGKDGLPPVHAVSNTPETLNHTNVQFERIIQNSWGNFKADVLTHSFRFIIGEFGETVTIQPGEIIVYSAGNSQNLPYLDPNDKNKSVVIQAEEGFDGSYGFAFDTGMTGSNSQVLHISVEARENEYNTIEYFMINDWSRVTKHKGYPEPTDEALPKIGVLTPFYPQQAADARVPPTTNNTIDISFTKLGYDSQPVFQSDFYMKTSESPNAIALAPYNNPRARTTMPIGLENSKYKPSAPLWDLTLSEVFGMGDVANADTENHGFWGESNVGGESFVTLYEVPTTPLTSLGQFMHANIAYRGHTPLYPVGSSFASPFIPLDQYFAEIPHSQNGEFTYDACVPDISYLMNEALWDGYFFSTLAPQKGSVFGLGQDKTIGDVVDDFARGAVPLPNKRITFIGDDAGGMSEGTFITRIVDGDDIAGNSHELSAGNLGIKGAFNINSTSVEAWKSLLSGLRDEVIAYYDAEDQSFDTETANASTPFSKFTLPNGTRDDAWRGYSQLNDEQIRDLAVAIVANIHERGPFPTLASFINRELTPGPTGLAGVLEASIQQTTINNHHNPLTADTNFLLQPGNINRYDSNTPLSRETGIPGFLTQADILLAIGSVITNRSDTFIIRSYGEASNPITRESSKAWLEAIVQRIGAPVQAVSSDPFDPDFFTPVVDEHGTSLGRQFKVLSIRWLDEGEI